MQLTTGAYFIDDHLVCSFCRLFTFHFLPQRGKALRQCPIFSISLPESTATVSRWLARPLSVNCRLFGAIFSGKHHYVTTTTAKYELTLWAQEIEQSVCVPFRASLNQLGKPSNCSGALSPSHWRVVSCAQCAPCPLTVTIWSYSSTLLAQQQLPANWRTCSSVAQLDHLLHRGIVLADWLITRRTLSLLSQMVMPTASIDTTRTKRLCCSIRPLQAHCQQERALDWR